VQHYSDDDWDPDKDEPKEPVVKPAQGTKRRKSGQGLAAYGTAAKRARAQALGENAHLPFVAKNLHQPLGQDLHVCFFSLWQILQS
jgi:hypothetical protein